MIERAIEIAVNAHKNQKDKSGAPYILHLIRVMEKGKTEIEKILTLTRFHTRISVSRAIIELTFGFG